MSKKWWLLSLYGFSAFAQQSTSLAPSPSPQPSATPDAPPVKIMSAELQSYLEPFIYDAKNRRDPFHQYFEPGTPGSGEGEFQGPLLPLQRFDLDDIHLIGIIWDVREPKAMFMDPNSQVHILAREDRIGKNNGFLAAIREGEVVVIETIRTRGETIRTTRVIKISR
jgi:type IV pilus assembly protein PilP